MDIVIKGLCKQFGRVDALNEVDAAFAPGIVGLLGPNGAKRNHDIKFIKNSRR